jgi:hypothetical protein
VLKLTVPVNVFSPEIERTIGVLEDFAFERIRVTDSLPADVQTWLSSVEARIDGLHLEDIEEEAEQIAGGDPGRAKTLFRIARRMFYRRVEQIIAIMDIQM